MLTSAINKELREEINASTNDRFQRVFWNFQGRATNVCFEWWQTGGRLLVRYHVSRIRNVTGKWRAECARKTRVLAEKKQRVKEWKGKK